MKHTKPVISVRNLSKRYYIENGSGAGKGMSDLLAAPFRLLFGNGPENGKGFKEIMALDGISIDIMQGDKVGIIGRNGAGKTTLLKILSRIVYPSAGEAVIRGRVTSLLEVGTGFNMNLTGKENIFLNASIHGLSKPEIEDIYENIVEFSGVSKFINTPVKFYSKGMYMRLAFAVAAHLDPDIMMLDEVLAVGDLAFQKKCLNRVKGMATDGRTILMVSHSMGNINRFCDKCIWLEDGRIVMAGDVAEVTAAYSETVLNVKSSVSFKKEDKTTEKSEGQETEQESSAESDSENTGRADLINARIIDSKRESCTVIPVDQPVGIEFTYKVRSTEYSMVPAMALIDKEDNTVFWAVDGNKQHHENIKKDGVHTSTVWIPGNFLNEGNYYVNLSVATPDTSPQIKHFYYDKALSFLSTEAVDNVDTARGIMPRNFPGSIRPKLNWEYDS